MINITEIYVLHCHHLAISRDVKGEMDTMQGFPNSIKERGRWEILLERILSSVVGKLRSDFDHSHRFKAKTTFGKC